MRKYLNEFVERIDNNINIMLYPFLLLVTTGLTTYNIFNIISKNKYTDKNKNVIKGLLSIYHLTAVVSGVFFTYSYIKEPNKRLTGRQKVLISIFNGIRSVSLIILNIYTEKLRIGNNNVSDFIQNLNYIITVINTLFFFIETRQAMKYQKCVDIYNVECADDHGKCESDKNDKILNLRCEKIKEYKKKLEDLQKGI